MRMVTGFLPPSRGSVAIDGHDLLKRADRRQAAHRLPAGESAALSRAHRPPVPGLRGRDQGRPARAAAAVVDRAIQRANLRDVAGKRISTLSKGFKQRVGLAQAIVHEPPVLVLDEPTSSLDPKQRVEVRDLIVGAARRAHGAALHAHPSRSEPDHRPRRHHQPRPGDGGRLAAESLAAAARPRRGDRGSRRRRRRRRARCAFAAVPGVVRRPRSTRPDGDRAPPASRARSAPTCAPRLPACSPPAGVCWRCAANRSRSRRSS